MSITGDVARRGAQEAAPLPDTWAVLHRVTRAGGAAADSVRTDPRGRFHFRAAADSETVYLVSVRYAGIAYFSQPVHGFTPVDTLATIEVFDTTYGAPPIEVRQRHLIVSAPAAGGREVVEFIELGNAGATTRVADEAGPPTWAGRLPAGITEMNVGESDFSADAVQQRGDSVLVFGPIPPGERQLMVRYTLPTPRRDFEVAVDQPTGTLALLLEDPGGEVLSGSLEALGTRSVENRTLHVYRGRNLAVGTVVRVRLAGRGPDLGWPLAAIAVTVGAALIGGLAYAKKRRPVAASAPATSDALATEIAALDARYRGREREVSATDWAGYEARRRALKEQLKARLARERGSP